MARWEKNGVLYIFRVPIGSSTPIDLNALISEFTSFIEICSTNIEAAEKIIRHSMESSKDVDLLVRRYSAEAKRLLLDLQHERELKLLQIRHRLEAEINEVKISGKLNDYISNQIYKHSSLSRTIIC